MSVQSTLAQIDMDDLAVVLDKQIIDRTIIVKPL
jgi:hypothetical protein